LRLVHFDAEKLQTLEDAGADEQRIFTDASGEDDPEVSKYLNLWGNGCVIRC
jgi:hypothetical protein